MIFFVKHNLDLMFLVQTVLDPDNSTAPLIEATPTPNFSFKEAELPFCLMIPFGASRYLVEMWFILNMWFFS